MARNSPSEPRLRLFVAVDPPAAARRAIGDWRDGLTGGDEPWRPVPAEFLHVTLAFLGGLPEASVPAISAVLDAAPAISGPLVPTGLAGLPPRRPRLLALDLDDPSGSVADVQAHVASNLAAEGLFEPEKRPFWPHITLTRARRGTRPGIPSDTGALPTAFTPARLVLYRSVTGPGGARYEALHAVPQAAP